METPTIISSVQQAKKNNFPIKENISPTTTVGESNEQKTTKKISLIIEKFIAEISSCFPSRKRDLLSNSDEKEPKKKKQLSSSVVSMEQCTILKPSYIEYSSSLSLFLQQRHKELLALHQTNQNQNKNPAGRGNISIIDISSPADVLNSIAKLFAAGAGADANANGHQDHNNKKSHQINGARSHNNNYYTTQTEEEEEEEEGDIFAIFYIGHGQAMTGDWCWKKAGRISLFDIIWVIKQTNLHQTKKNLFISSDADFSGAWINQLKDLLLFLPSNSSTLFGQVNHTTQERRGFTHQVSSSSSSSQQQQRVLFNKDPRAILSLPIKSGLYMRRKFKDSSFQQQQKQQQQRRVFPLSSSFAGPDNNSLPANIRTTRSIWQQEESLLDYLKNYLSIQTSTNPTEASTYTGVFFADLDIPVVETVCDPYYSTGLFGQNNPEAYIKKRFEDHYHQHPKCYTAFYDKYLLTLQKFTPLFRTIDM